MKLPKEKDLQLKTITNHLFSLGYEKGSNADYNYKYNLISKDLIRFIIHTQEELLNEYKQAKGSRWEDELLDLVDINIRNRGIIDVLRNGVDDYSLSDTLKLMYFQPNSNKNKTLLEKYKENIFKVINEFYYSQEKNDRIDTVIFINGFPLIFIELKNTLTGQNYVDGIKQWKYDRDYKEKIFKEKAIVFFSVDDNEVYMTTELKGKQTLFLPFNKGYNMGSGNPFHPEKYRTYYLWEDILTKNIILDIIKRFYYIQKEETPKGRIIKKKKIFPRFHQLDVVRRIIKDVQDKGVGSNYLIQHSAGSGKTNSISWLAHRLSTLHNAKDEAIFNSIIVITDRKILNKQLQDAIFQLEHKHGVVEKIDDKKTSIDLAYAIESNKKIIITTIQKFPYVLEKIENLSGKNYAVIIDEAHSSTTGESIGALKMSLAGKTAEEFEKNDITSDDIMAEYIGKRSKLENISFFAFTATPKAKTFEIFGTKEENGKPHEFHLYSMRQAIEENFIIDVLQNYTIYERYYKVAKIIKEDPEFDKIRAAKAINRFVELNEHNIREKVEIIVEDFRLNREMWLDGKSKGMIVTSSRLSAVKYKIIIEKYLKEKGYSMKTLVAFSGKIQVDGVEYTEESMNNGVKNLPEEFEKDEFKLLIVADKYQTGFDQPKLCAMYIDKSLGGVKCVQTLSRLNRTYKDKQTFILDFVNKIEEIQEAFKPYYENTNIKEITDPNSIFEKFYELKDIPIYIEEDIEEFVRLYFKKIRTTKQDARMNSILDKGILIFLSFDDDLKELFKSKVRVYISLYKFLLNMYPIKNLDLLKLYIYLIALLKKLPTNKLFDLDLEGLLSLDSHKLSKIFEGNISITKGEGELIGIGNFKEEKKEEKLEKLDEIITRMNDIYGIGLSEEDKVVFENIEKVFMDDTNLQQIAIANIESDFKEIFGKKYFKRGLIRQKNDFENIITNILSNEGLSNFLMNAIAEKIYKKMKD
ncbi:DEAD/DEAH box helicase family protein [Cetobacterium sp.]|uniref:type I restriction endonuclease subunit R n=1 Tax=Cetobacterium sp. TaxID=2071632 RepID=UPI0025C1E352|nr:DEAD/DEAH box helicase family protein [Cetobacterium sp.]